MGLFDFFKSITTRFRNEEIKRLPEAQYINSATAQQPVIHENAYVEAYSRQFNTQLSNLIKLEENGKILKIHQDQNKMQVKGIKKLKESLKVEDGREIDLYSGVLEKNEKKKIVYFGLQNGVNLNKVLADKNKSYKVSNKMVKMFTIPNTKPTSRFIGSLVEDDIYKSYCIAKSDKLENYVNKIEERRLQILQENKKKLKAEMADNIKVKSAVKTEKQKVLNKKKTTKKHGN